MLSHLALIGFSKTYIQVLQTRLKVPESIVPHVPAILQEHLLSPFAELWWGISLTANHTKHELKGPPEKPLLTKEQTPIDVGVWNLTFPLLSFERSC